MDKGDGGSNRRVLSLIVTCFFLCGFSTTLSDTLIPYLVSRNGLGYGVVMSIQVAFYMGYFLLCPIAGALVPRVGYRRSACAALLCGAAGYVSLQPALAQSFVWALGSVFLIGGGVAVLQVVANPWALESGPAASAVSRLTFAQTFTAVGMLLSPWVASFVFESLPLLYATVGIASMLMGIYSLRMPEASSLCPAPSGGGALRGLGSSFLALFTYVGVEVAVGSFLLSYLHDSNVAGLSLAAGARACSLYWGGVLIGRLVGAAYINEVRAGPSLMLAAGVAAVLLTTAAISSGPLAVVAIVSVGLCNAIMFPIIFSAGLASCSASGAQAAGVLCMANIGGACWPLAQGVLADAVGLRLSFALPVLGYVFLWRYALMKTVEQRTLIWE
ncbi:MAG: MFS transporter [Chlamydiia bacterium]|nr:MFS transporter [Chlamydiia bacterium]